MKKITFRLFESRRYQMDEYTDSSIQMLDYFLPEISERDFDYFKEWALSKNPMGTGTNFGDLDKKNGKILVFNQSPADNEVPLVLTIDSFIKMMEDWFYLVRQKVPVIVIKYENETAFVGTE